MFKSKKISFRKLAFIITFFALDYFFANFISSAILNVSSNLSLGEPSIGSYRSDEYIFLKTFYLVKGGQNYYQSFEQAVAEDARGIVLTNDSFTWRTPTVFYLWKFTASNGQQIFRNFWFLVTITLVFIYFILRKFVAFKLALLGTIIVIPYFVDILNYKTAFLFTEWWAWFFLIIGLGYYVHNNLRFAWPFFVLAVLTRELMLIPICAFLGYSIILKKNRFYFVSVIISFLVFYLFHKGFVLKEAGFATNSLLIGTRLHGFDKQSFLTMISFSMKEYPFVSYKIHYLLVLVSTIGLMISFMRKSDKNIFYVYLAAFSFLISLPFITTSFYNDYWGILFMPTLIFTIPLALNKK